jgi:isopentenyl-diphosphate delta-isomerase
MNSAAEMVVLVDDFDNEVGVEEKMRAHTLGLLHRAFSVFIFRRQANKIEVLLQQRQQDKYHCGGLWTNTCCSHPRVGESVMQAANRRLMEEMGVQAQLHVIGAFKYRAEFANGLIEHEFDHTLVGKYTGDIVTANPEEVQDYTWISIDELETNLKANPHLFTPWLRGALDIVLANWAIIEEL